MVWWFHCLWCDTLEIKFEPQMEERLVKCQMNPKRFEACAPPKFKMMQKLSSKESDLLVVVNMVENIIKEDGEWKLSP